MINFEIGDWIKVIGEEDYYNVKSIDADSGYVEIEDIGGHTWYTAVNTIKRKCTNKEIYGNTEKTTADEFNEEIITYGDKKLKDEYSHFGDDEEDKEKDYGPPYGPHNPTGNKGEKK